MLSVRLAPDLATELDVFCATGEQSKSKVVQLALRNFLRDARDDPFFGLIGSGNRACTTDQVMRASRGDDWRQP